MDAEARVREGDQRRPPCIMPLGPISPAVEQPETGMPGKASPGRRQHFGVVLDREEGDDVLEVRTAELGLDLGNRLVGGRVRARRHANAAVAQRGVRATVFPPLRGLCRTR